MLQYSLAQVQAPPQHPHETSWLLLPFSFPSHHIPQSAVIVSTLLLLSSWRPSWLSATVLTHAPYNCTQLSLHLLIPWTYFSVLTRVTSLKHIFHNPPQTLTTPHQEDKVQAPWQSIQGPSIRNLLLALACISILKPHPPINTGGSLLPPAKHSIHFLIFTHPGMFSPHFTHLSRPNSCHLHYGRLLQHLKTSLAAPFLHTL